jgi:hypothetical protein
MYYVKFLQNDVDMVEQLIEIFGAPFTPNIFFCQKENIWQLKNESDLFFTKSNLSDPKYMELVDFILLFTSDKSRLLNNVVSLNFSSIKQFNELVIRLMDQFGWIIFTCGDHSFKEVVFATKFQFIDQYFDKIVAEVIEDAHKFQESILIPPVIMAEEDYAKVFAKYKNTNFLISKHLLESDSSCRFNAIVFSELDQPLDRLVRSLNLTAQDLILVSSMIPYDCRSFTSQKVMNLSFYSKAVRPLSGSRDTGVYQEYLRENELFLLEFDSIKKLTEVCYSLKSSESETILVIPKKTNIDVLEKMFIELLEMGIEILYGDEFMCVSKVTDSVQWFYGIDRVYSHECCSIFMSNNPNLITQFENLDIEDGYRLIGCF